MTEAHSALLNFDRPGVRVAAVLPDPAWAPRWDDILVPEATKRRLLNHALLCLRREGRASGVDLPWHGLALLSGPPGTGKTTLAHGLGQAVATVLAERGLAEHTLFARVDPHAFPSEFLGESQRATARLFSHTLPELGAQGLPTVVLIDEVESLAVARTKASAGSNPIDVHRATDALLTGIDLLAERCPNVVVVATTNDGELVDEAFVSRVDLHERFTLPPVQVVAAILAASFAALGAPVGPDDPSLVEVAERCVAERVDPRQVRKLVLRALVNGDLELALAPHKLTPEQCLHLVSNTLSA